MKAIKRLWKAEAWFVLFTIPGIALFCLAVVIPLILGAKYSFTNWDGVSNVLHYIGWKNYDHVINDPQFWGALGHTFKFAIILTLLVNVISLLLALVLDSYLKFRTIFRTIFYLPTIISVVLAAFIWNNNYSKALPSLFAFFGYDDMTSPLGNPDYALFGLIIIAVWQSIGTPMIIYIAGLQNIPPELLESAEIDGAGTMYKFWHVTFPLIAPSVTINAILTLTGSLKIFDLVYIATKGGPGFSTEVLSTYIYRVAYTSFQGGYGAALSMVFFVVLVLVTIVQLLILRKREVEI
ncbi:sugar ABC transporter permease [Paenibacillus psychroresistens]|uniref:Sugar ABC transporter permease n=1 Tax=Paenibacillus psychroresistens TaxID=1778678 RepID=A0A6B8RWW7_9BACL|nr:sugar ABC transporter permease [Paenibacillus psychroresistens]QGQ99863.1 sugar ABC transporter permease [Paenibacillus psychroresistens]